MQPELHAGRGKTSYKERKKANYHDQTAKDNAEYSSTTRKWLSKNLGRLCVFVLWKCVCVFVLWKCVCVCIWWQLCPSRCLINAVYEGHSKASNSGSLMCFHFVAEVLQMYRLVICTVMVICTICTICIVYEPIEDSVSVPVKVSWNSYYQFMSKMYPWMYRLSLDFFDTEENLKTRWFSG